MSNEDIDKLKSKIYIHREDFRLIYKMEVDSGLSNKPKLLGSGTFGTVRLAYKTNNPEKKFAIKSILREKIE